MSPPKSKSSTSDSKESAIISSLAEKLEAMELRISKDTADSRQAVLSNLLSQNVLIRSVMLRRLEVLQGSIDHIAQKMEILQNSVNVLALRQQSLETVSLGNFEQLSNKMDQLEYLASQTITQVSGSFPAITFSGTISGSFNQSNVPTYQSNGSGEDPELENLDELMKDFLADISKSPEPSGGMDMFCNEKL